ncbi:esterase-like [Telopea speciosissima]|uniref:esterase-like n=1 Tax=Telopea speciosissima TaxID=54955 RepID=UPI001CC43D7F|nr:esterase-like [Telopea speciosissima]
METHRVTQFLIILYCCSTLMVFNNNLNHAFAAELSCEFPAIFNFGDSNSDTGGLAAAFTPPKSPYGETFFHAPAGRYSDGRLIIDFIAASLGLEYLSAYLNSVGSNFTQGADFATAASTITPQNRGLNQGGYSPFYLGVQYSQFQQFMSRSQTSRNQGYTYTELLPVEEYFSQALYTFDIGQNDIGAGIFGNLSVQEVNATIPDIINQFSIDFKSVYDEGARFFWIHNTGPIGCLPYVLANYPVEASEYDNASCAIPYNMLAQYFNQKLKDLVIELRNELTFATITYVDIYTVKYNLISQANKYGFEQPLVTCCGYGINKYNYNTNAVCGGTINAINGTQIVVGSCENPSVRVNWDGVHYTEAANKWIFDQIVDGNFSNPPVPLNMACHKFV